MAMLWSVGINIEWSVDALVWLSLLLALCSAELLFPGWCFPFRSKCVEPAACKHLATVARLREKTPGLGEVARLLFQSAKVGACAHVVADACLNVETLRGREVARLFFEKPEIIAPTHVAAVARLCEEAFRLGEVARLLFQDAKDVALRGLATVARPGKSAPCLEGVRCLGRVSRVARGR